MYSYRPPHMAKKKLGDQLEHTYSSSVRIRDVALKTCRRWWTIGRSGERGSGISVLAARHDDDDYDIHTHTHTHTHTHIYIYIYIYIYTDFHTKNVLISCAKIVTRSCNLCINIFFIHWAVSDFLLVLKLLWNSQTIIFLLLRKIWKIKTQNNLRNFFPPRFFKIHF